MKEWLNYFNKEYIVKSVNINLFDNLTPVVLNVNNIYTFSFKCSPNKAIINNDTPSKKSLLINRSNKSNDNIINTDNINQFVENILNKAINNIIINKKELNIIKKLDYDNDADNTNIYPIFKNNNKTILKCNNKYDKDKNNNFNNVNSEANINNNIVLINAETKLNLDNYERNTNNEFDKSVNLNIIDIKSKFKESMIDVHKYNNKINNINSKYYVNTIPCKDNNDIKDIFFNNSKLTSSNRLNTDSSNSSKSQNYFGFTKITKNDLKKKEINKFRLLNIERQNNIYYNNSTNNIYKKNLIQKLDLFNFNFCINTNNNKNNDTFYNHNKHRSEINDYKKPYSRNTLLFDTKEKNNLIIEKNEIELLSCSTNIKDSVNCNSCINNALYNTNTELNNVLSMNNYESFESKLSDNLDIDYVCNGLKSYFNDDYVESVKSSSNNLFKVNNIYSSHNKKSVFNNNNNNNNHHNYNQSKINESTDNKNFIINSNSNTNKKEINNYVYNNSTNKYVTYQMPNYKKYIDTSTNTKKENNNYLSLYLTKNKYKQKNKYK